MRLDMRQVNDEAVAEYAQAGVTDLVVSVSSGDVNAHHEAMRQLATYI